MSVWGEVKKIGKVAEKSVKNINKAVSGLTKGVADAALKTAFSGISAYDIVFNKGKTLQQVEKSVNKAAKKAENVGKNIVNSSVKSVSSLAKGDIIGAVTNAANVSTVGTMDFTGKKKGLVNIDSKKYIAKWMGIKPLSSASMSTSGTGLGVAFRSKGLLSQLRKAKGNVGGGSYTETVKNPLGGESGMTGR